MPIYEYECRTCHEEFEVLVLKGTVPACPSCKGQDLERLLSGFAVSTAELSQARVKAARNASRRSANFRDKQVAEAEHLIEHVTEHRNALGHEGPKPLKIKPKSE
jgi:putative FmdB family regulatory protein